MSPIEPMDSPRDCLDPSLSIAQILERWPAVVEVLVRRRLGCVGCAMAPFDTLADMAAIYELDLATLRAEIAAAAARPTAEPTDDDD